MKFLSTALYTLFVTLLLSVAGLFLATLLPIPGNIEVKIVKSGSMEPAIPTGALVVVKPEALYGIGNVITFGADTKTEVPTTHRIVSTRAEGGQMYYTTKGDANEEADPQEVAARDVIGKVVFSLPYAGFILDFARQPLGFAMLIGLPAALVIFEEAYAIYREVHKMMRKREDEDEDRGSPLPPESTLQRFVYLRKRAMDEIFVPMTMVAQASRERVQHYKDRYVAASLACLFCVSLSFSGVIAEKTIAYQRDLESAIGNFLAAGEWGIAQIEVQTFSVFAETLPETSPEGDVLGASDEGSADALNESEEPQPLTEEIAPLEEEQTGALQTPPETTIEPEPVPDPAPVQEPPEETPAEISPSTESVVAE